MYRKRNHEFIIIDVRTKTEYLEERIKGAQLLPLQNIQQGELPPVPKHHAVYVYCRSGNRASIAKAICEENGFEDVINIGGVHDAIQYGFGVEK